MENTRKFRKTVGILLAIAVLASCVCLVGCEGATVSDMGPTGTCETNPFDDSIVNGGHYRIPALWAASDGSLLAAADARWGAREGKNLDGGNTDTVVSISRDDGNSWEYAMAAYVDDTFELNAASASFIDPAFAERDGVVYLLVDLFPGYSELQPCTTTVNSNDNTNGTGCDAEGNLLLKENALAAEYGYYLKNGKIYSVATNRRIPGWSVDEWFNLSKDGTHVGNLFTWSESWFQPLMTSYILLLTSTDGGISWGEPSLLNASVKDEEEKNYIVSPGRGLVTEDGTIMFPMYAYDGTEARSSFIYSTDGINWMRSESCADWSSESELVELADGTIRMFYRHPAEERTEPLHYVDFTKENGGYAPGKPVTYAAAGYPNCNLSAISYSKTLDGAQLIMMSCPTSGRKNGKIFVFSVNEDHTMSLINEVAVNEGAFAYSSLAEQKDGNIGILYEMGNTGGIVFESIAIGKLVPQLAEQ